MVPQSAAQRQRGRLPGFQDPSLRSPGCSSGDQHRDQEPGKEPNEGLTADRLRETRIGEEETGHQVKKKRGEKRSNARTLDRLWEASASAHAYSKRKAANGTDGRPDSTVDHDWCQEVVGIGNHAPIMEREQKKRGERPEDSTERNSALADCYAPRLGPACHAPGEPHRQADDRTENCERQRGILEVRGIR